MVRSVERDWLRTINLGFFYLHSPFIYWNVNANQFMINSTKQNIRCISIFLNILFGFLSLFVLAHYYVFRSETSTNLNFGQISILALTVCVTFASTSVICLYLLYPSTISGINQLIQLRVKVYKCKI